MRTSGLRQEGGFTLVELLVVMVLMGVVGSVVGTSLVRGMQVSAEAQSRIQGLSELQRGMERLAREVRVADPLCLTLGQEEWRLGASVYRDGKRYAYDFYLQGSGADEELRADILMYDPPEDTTPSTVTNGTLIAETGNSILSVPLFEYLDQNGDPPFTPGAAAQVQINLARQVSGDDPIQVSSTVEVRNTRYTGGGGLC